MNLKAMLTIAKKEFFSFLNTPLSFVIIVPFLLISTFIYLRTSLVVGEASLRPYFELLPWFLVLLAPALSMKLITDEKKGGTLELLFAHPLSEADVVLGKFFGVFSFFLLILLTTLGLPASLIIFANPDPGIILAQYIGAIFVGATFLSIGLLASAYVENAIGSFLLSCAVSFVMILIGLEFVTLMLPWPFSRIMEEMAILNHMNNIARGLLDIRDILYFVTVTSLFLTATVMKLAQRKLQEDKREKRKLTIALSLIVGIGVVLNIFMSFYPIRLDLTEQKLFTLSAGSRQTLTTLPDIVTISVFASRNLPGYMQLTLKETSDLLKDYQRVGKKIVVRTLYPETDPEAADEARKAGIQEVTFNKIGGGKFEVQSGFLGISIRYGEKTETLPFLQDTSDLEYQLTRRIRRLTAEKEKTVGIYNNSFGRYQLLDEIVKTQYSVTSVDMAALSSIDKRKELDLLIVVDDGNTESTASALIKDYLSENGKALILANGVAKNLQSLAANKSRSTLTSFLTEYGVTIKNDLIYDLLLNEILTFGGNGQMMRYATPYPFWLRALPADNSFSPLSGIKSVTLGWPSSIEINKKEGINYNIILTTSPNAGRQEENLNISPTEIDGLSNALGEKIPLAVSLEKENLRLVVVGNSDFASDQFLQSFSENVAFVTNTVDYLVADKDLASIPRKTAVRAVFRFRQSIEPIIFQYANLLLPPIIVVIFAFFRLSRRRKLTARVYEG